MLASAGALGLLVVALLRVRLARRLERRAAAVERAAIASGAGGAAFDTAPVVATARAHLAAVAGEGGRELMPAVEERFGRHSLESLRELAIEWDPQRPRPFALSVVKPRFHVVELERDTEDRIVRVTVRVEALVRAWASRLGYWGARVANGLVGMPSVSARATRVVAYWVFEPGAGGWSLVRVEPGWSGRHRLTSDPSGEARLLRRLRGESVRELIELPESPEVPFEIATNLPPDPDAALRELVLVDDRFAHGVVELAVREAVERWERAAGDDPAPLEEVAAPRAVRALLARERVIRGARLERMRVVRVWALRVPPEIDVELGVRAWWGRGDSVRGEEFLRSHWWRLAATASQAVPWRLVDASDRPIPARPRRRARAARHVLRR